MKKLIICVFGILLVACGTPNDRKDISDVGWGGLITYDNVYFFGITSHSGDVGYFVSIDLANLLRDKVKPHWDKYKK